MLTSDDLIAGLVGKRKKGDYCFGTLLLQQSPGCSMCQPTAHHGCSDRCDRPGGILLLLQKSVCVILEDRPLFS